MQDEHFESGPQENPSLSRTGIESGQEIKTTSQLVDPEAARIRAARAKLIEETTYRLTDLFTIISARIEILSEKVPDMCREELRAIRGVLTRGVELNNRLSGSTGVPPRNWPPAQDFRDHRRLS